MSAAARTVAPIPRSPTFSFDRGSSAAGADEAIPRHWLGGHALGTHIANGVNLLFPAGERFFIRSVRHYLDNPAWAQPGSPEDQAALEELRRQARGFFGQEGWHAQAHERFFQVLEGQGYSLQSFLRVYQAIAYGFIERVAPRKLSLSVTAACEHFTATLAEQALTDGVLQNAHPTVRALLLWHAAEEIEHKAVAFDVLQRVSRSYALRVTGLGVASLLLVSFWWSATLMLLAQDLRKGSLRLGHGRMSEELQVLRRLRQQRQARGGGLLRGVMTYLRRDFHPDQQDNRALASDYLRSVGMA